MSTSALELEIRDSLREHYRIGEINSVSSIQNSTFATQNPAMQGGANVWRIDTASGVYCLKRHRPGKPLSRIAFEDDFQYSLYRRSRNLVAEPIKTYLGKLNFQSGDQHFHLERFILDARHYYWWLPAWSSADCNRAGQALRWFHDMTVGLAGSVDRSRRGASCAAPGGEFVTGIDPLGSEILNSLRRSLACSTDSSAPGDMQTAPAAPSAQTLPAQRNEKSGQTAQTEPAVQSEPTVQIMQTCVQLTARSEAVLLNLGPDAHGDIVVHGDYHPGNTLFVGNELKAIIDFEHSHVEHRLYDVAYGMLMFCTSWTAKSAGPLSLERQLAIDFLTGYYLKDRAPLHIDALSLDRYVVVSCALLATWLMPRCSSLPSSSSGSGAATLCLQHVLAIWRGALESTEGGQALLA